MKKKWELKSYVTPKLFEKGTAEFWQNPYIAKQLLKAHLNPAIEGASRDFLFIDESVQWINDIAPNNSYPKVIDLGCGPGLYTERLAKKGYQVSGIDFSEGSINYAKKSAAEQKLLINYSCENYLNWQPTTTYDVALLIYCDYGVLSAKHRKQLLERIYGGLRKGGILLLDVFTLNKLTSFSKNSFWSYVESPNFWSENEHLELSRKEIYEDITLEQTIVIEETKTEIYNIWYQYFEQERLTEELLDSGFSIEGIYNNLKGDTEEEASETIAVIARK